MQEQVAQPIVSPQKGAIATAVANQQSQETEYQPPVDPDSSEERAQLVPQEPWETSPLFYEMANFLNVDAKDYNDSAERISVITDWAIQKANSNKIEDIMHTVRELESKLQPPPWGEKRSSHIYRALRMESRYEAAKKAMGAFTKTGKW